MEQFRRTKTCAKASISEDCEYDFETGDELSDLKLIVEAKCLFVHKAILGIC